MSLQTTYVESKTEYDLWTRKTALPLKDVPRRKVSRFDALI